MQCETAVAGVPGGPYGKITMQKTGVKKAEKALRLFYFGKNKMRFFQNNPYVFIDGHMRGWFLLVFTTSDTFFLIKILSP